MSQIVVVGRKRINTEKFEPRAKRCSHCNYCEELKPQEENKVRCKIFGWLISRRLARQQAVCSRRDKPTEVTVTSGDIRNEENLGVIQFE